MIISPSKWLAEIPSLKNRDTTESRIKSRSATFRSFITFGIEARDVVGKEPELQVENWPKIEIVSRDSEDQKERDKMAASIRHSPPPVSAQTSGR